MRNIWIAALVALATMLASAASSAEGDAAKGRKRFALCKTCHSVSKGVNKIGPSLHCVIGRRAGTEAKFIYSKSIVDAGKQGLVWDKKKIFDYLANAKKYIAKHLGKKTVKLKMYNNFPNKKFRLDVVAYLASVCK
jgi:cytochrome c